MRFFSSNRNNEPVTDDSEDRDPIEGEPTDDPESTPEPEPQEWALAEGVTLDSLYDANGESFYVDENGTATDENGNPIPATRAEAEGLLAPETTEPEPAPAPRPTPPNLRSPMADGLLTEDEIAALTEDGYDEKSIRAMMLLASKVADRKINAYEQQRFAGQGLVDQDTLTELAPRIAKAKSWVPENLKGTREGAMTELALAALDEAMETGDFSAAFARFAPRQADPDVQPRTPSLKPPTQRMPSPRSNSGVQPFKRGSGPKDAANESFHKDGLDGDLVAILQRERRGARY